MKYNHLFSLLKNDDSTKIYKSDDIFIRLDFLADMLRVAIYKNEEDLFPTFSVSPDDYQMPRHGRKRLSTEGFSLVKPIFIEEKDKDIYKFGDITLEIQKLNFNMSYYQNDKLLFKDREYISYNFENELGKGSYHYLTRENDEHIYGLGDKSGSINKNKRHFRMETFDAMGYDANSSDPLYKQIPFYICKNSIGSYGIYYDTYSTGEFDFGKELNNYYGIYKYFHCEEENLIFYVMFGEVKDIVTKFSHLCGRNFFPPKWTLKYCGSTMAYTDSKDADKELRNFVSLCKENEIDCGGFYLSSGYTQIGEKRYVFHWNKEKIPSPKGLAKYFKDNSIKFLPNIKPAFLTDHPLYKFIADKGWFLHYEDGRPAIFPFWSGFGSYFDFTNDEAFDFWSQCVKENLVDLGYKNIWNDNNEYDIHDESVFAHGFNKPIKAALIRPVFSYLMTLASLNGQEKDKRHMSITRSGIAGLQRISETWTGDNNTSFKDFRGNHKIAMTLTLSGIYNFGQDIGGFAGPCPDKELFMRWLQYGVFTPRFVLHSWNPDNSVTMPWLYKDMMKTVKSIFSLRKRLLPYFYNNLYFSVKDYKPMISPLFLTYPSYDEESDFFLVGESILACPIFDQGKDTIEVSLPNDKIWYHDNKAYHGKNTFKVSISDDPLYFIKEGSVIPIDDNGLVFEIYPLEKGEFDFDFFTDDGESLLKDDISLIHLTISCNDTKVIVKASDDIKVVLKDNLKRELILR